MVVFYYLLLKPDVPASKVIVPQYNLETGEDPPASPCLELALGEWMEQFVEQHLERQQPRPAPQDALCDDCDRNENAAIFVPDPIADALTLWMKQPLTGKMHWLADVLRLTNDASRRTKNRRDRSLPIQAELLTRL
jgi:hypothetical protein